MPNDNCGYKKLFGTEELPRMSLAYSQVWSEDDKQSVIA